MTTFANKLIESRRIAVNEEEIVHISLSCFTGASIDKLPFALLYEIIHTYVEYIVSIYLPFKSIAYI